MSSGPARRHRHQTSIGPCAAADPGDFVQASGRAAPRRRWELWTLGPSVLAYVLAVEAVALVVTVVMISRERVRLGDLLILAALVGLGLAKEELTRHVEGRRRRFSDTPHQNMTSVWTFAAAMLLPPGLAVAVVAPLYAYLWLRIWSRMDGTRAWKVVFSAAAVTLSCHATTGVVHAFGTSALSDWRAVAAATLAILLYSVVNLGLVAGAIALMISERTPGRLFGTAADAALEYATLTLGAVATALMQYAPLSVLLLIPALVVLHKNVLIRQLEEAASKDPKTGLLNATTWMSLARAELDRARRDQNGLGILMLDLDDFKRINTEHGHLAADRVLIAVAAHLTQLTRPYDLLGRFGGDEFFLLCPGVDADALLSIAERVRASIEQLTIPEAGLDRPTTVSIGGARFPDVGSDLEDLLLAADNAVFAAKDQGRNRVVMRRRPVAIERQDSSGVSSN